MTTPNTPTDQSSADTNHNQQSSTNNQPQPTENKHHSPLPPAPNQPENNRPPFFVKSGLVLFFVFVLLIAGIVMVSYQTMFGRIQQSKKLVQIKQGDSYYGMIEYWQKEVPFFSSTLAKLYIKYQITEPLYLGTYQLPKNPTFMEALRVLQQGSDSALVKIQIIEGKTAKDLYNKLKSTKGIDLQVLNLPPEDLKSALDINATTPKGKFQHNLEGWFAPNTYIYSEGTSDKQILKDLYQRQQHILELAWENRAANLPYKTPYDALIMASIIEKETGLREERAEVAGVFVNRLRKGMKLQTDPTIIYGMGERYDGNIRKADIKEKTAYNTYQIKGLPPTPIALPSAAAIDAALHPADTENLFFVATGKGGHKFSKTYKEHQQAVAEYLAVMKDKKEATDSNK